MGASRTDTNKQSELQETSKKGRRKRLNPSQRRLAAYNELHWFKYYKEAGRLYCLWGIFQEKANRAGTVYSIIF